jgi:ribosomal protein S18 acetylase RimI-like enzyme
MDIKEIYNTHKGLSDVIHYSIGYPTKEKIAKILSSYEDEGHYIFGAFIDENIVGIIGICLNNTIESVIRHISVTPQFRRQGIAKQLILHVINHFNIKEIEAETDNEAIDFYHNLNFVCSPIEGKQVSRYLCKIQLL